MASRSLGELLLRPSTFTRIPQRTCPHNTRWISQTAPRPAQPARKDQDDPYSLSSLSRRERPSIISDLAPPPSQRPQQPNPRRSGPASANDAIRAIDSLVDSLPTTSKARKQPSSADEMRAARNANQAFGANFAKPGGRFTRGANRPRGLQFEEMESIPGEGEDMLPGLVQQETPAELLAAQQEATLSNYPRLNPSYGRTVTLDARKGRDIVRGIAVMGMMVARNKVKADFNRQKFHERGGLKRKRLNSERWRARFKLGFRAVTERVNALTRKGW